MAADLSSPQRRRVRRTPGTFVKTLGGLGSEVGRNRPSLSPSPVSSHLLPSPIPLPRQLYLRSISCVPIFLVFPPLPLTSPSPRKVGRFNRPRGVAVDPAGDAFFVADSLNHRVQAFRIPPAGDTQLHLIWQVVLSVGGSSARAASPTT